VLGTIIVAIVSFYTKLMVEYEKQNLSEAFYAINTLNLMFFSIVIYYSQKRNTKPDSIASNDFKG